MQDVIIRSATVNEQILTYELSMEDQCLADYKIKKGTGEYWRAIVALFFGSLVTFGAEQCVQPIIPVFTETFSLEPATASLAVSFGTGGMAIAMLFIAEFAKRLPRKGVMSLALIVSSILAVVMALSDYFGLILGLRLCQRILLAGFPAMATAYISEEIVIFLVIVLSLALMVSYRLLEGKK